VLLWYTTLKDIGLFRDIMGLNRWGWALLEKGVLGGVMQTGSCRPAYQQPPDLAGVAAAADAQSKGGREG
jgi:hypothetical protein